MSSSDGTKKECDQACFRSDHSVLVAEFEMLEDGLIETGKTRGGVNWIQCSETVQLQHRSYGSQG